MFRGLRRSIGQAAGGMMGLQAQGLMGAIGQRRTNAMGGYVDDSLPAQSAADPNFTLQSLQKRRRAGVMSGLGGPLGGK